MVETCPTCGACIPPKSLFNSKIKDAILDFIRRYPGCNREQIVSGVWSGDPNGGPSSPNIVSVHVHHMQAILAREGLRIYCSQGRAAAYRLVKLEGPKCL